MQFFEELKRRNVIKATIAYIVVSWVILQVISIVLPNIGAPAWVFKTLMFVIAIGFPIWIIFSWVYEVTPEGLKKTAKIPGNDAITAKTNKRLNIIIIITLILSIGVSYINKPNANTKKISPDKELTTDNTIAVLPFLDMSPNKDQEYLSDGIAEEILNSLCKFNELKVVGRTSSFSFKKKNEDLKTIGEMLNVANILEGSVRKNKDRIMITVRLTNAGNGFTLLSESYSDDLQNIFALQSRIATDIAEKIETKLSLHGKELLKRKKINPLAYEAYMKGKSQFVNGPLNMVKGELFGAKKYFEAAVALDSTFAEAQAYLAITYFNLADWALPREDISKIEISLDSALVLVERSLSLDSLNSGVHLAMGSYYFHQYNWVAAEKEKRKAVASNPGGTEEKFILASFLGQFGQAEEALKLDEEAMKLDPLNRDNKLYYARDLFRARKFDEGIRQCKLLLLENPNNPGAYQFLFLCHIGNKQFQEAGVALTKLAEVLGNHDLVAYYRNTSFKSATRKMLSNSEDSVPLILKGPITMATMYSILEDKDNTIKYIEIGYKNRDPMISMIRDCRFDFIRQDPRYIDLYEKVGFKAYDDYKAKQGVILK